MQKGEAAFRDDVEAAPEHLLALGREAGDQVGAERDVRAQARGRARAAAIACARLWRRFIRFRIRSSPACSDRWRCGISRGSSAEQPPTDRRRSRSDRARTAAAAAAPAPPRAAAAPSGRGSGCPADRRRRRSGRPRSARSRGTRPATSARACSTIASSGTERLGAAGIGDDAEGAAVVAALLHLQIGPRPGSPCPRTAALGASGRSERRGSAPSRRKRGSGRGGRLPERSSPAGASRRCRARGRLRRARRSARARASAAQPVTMIRASGCSRRARRIAWRAWRSASAVTAQVLTMTASAEPGLAGGAADDLALERVEPAAEGDDLDCRSSASAGRAARRRSCPRRRASPARS